MPDNNSFNNRNLNNSQNNNINNINDQNNKNSINNSLNNLNNQNQLNLKNPDQNTSQNTSERIGSTPNFQTQKNFQYLNEQKKINIIFLVITIIIIMLGVTALYFLFSGKGICSSNECFIKNANNCENSIFEINENETIYRFISFENCTVEKTITQVSLDEPDIIKSMFTNKSMVCKYEKGQFDEKLLTTLLGGLENCDGELKTSLYELALAHYELTVEEYEA